MAFLATHLDEHGRVHLRDLLVLRGIRQCARFRTNGVRAVGPVPGVSQPSCDCHQPDRLLDASAPRNLDTCCGRHRAAAEAIMAIVLGLGATFPPTVFCRLDPSW
jgi:hypothetical protein